MSLLAAIFTDHAVLQREKEITLWGSCPKGVKLEVSLVSQEYRKLATAEIMTASDTFCVSLPPCKAGGPYELILTQEGTVSQVLTDVMVGEVWLAGGQSNMEYALKDDKDAHMGSSDPVRGDVRFYQVLRQAYITEDFEARERENCWMTMDDPKMETWSAVGYHFARELSKKLGCCVGIIGCNWGGTSAAAWMDREALLADPSTACIWEEYAALLSAQDPAAYDKERRDYLAYQEAWQLRIDAFYAANPCGSWEEALEAAGPCRWPGPMGPKHEFRPCGLYETMLLRITPYTMRGFLYYQGESDDHHPEMYETLLTSLIRVWRRDFQDENLYAMLVQLPMHRYRNDPVTTSWAMIRQAQERVHKADPRSGLAVIIDQGEFDNIHPTHKKEVGHRLYLQAMAHVYGILSMDEACCPALEKIRFSSWPGQMHLSFTHCLGGFDKERYARVVKAPKNALECAYTGFEIAGEDLVFYPVEAIFEDGATELTLLIPREVDSPKSVRYLYAGYSMVPLFDKRGMPAAPFVVEIEQA